jgi:Sec-independent protein translocase protein TatA
MFDFSASQIGLVGLVALFAIGPERMPRVARGAGIMMGRFRRYVRSVRDEIDKEMDKTELRELKKRMQEATREAEIQWRAAGKDTTSLLQESAMAVEQVDQATSLKEPFSPDNDLSFKPPLISPVSLVQQARGDMECFGGDPFCVRQNTPPRSQEVGSADENGEVS